MKLEETIQTAKKPPKEAYRKEKRTVGKQELLDTTNAKNTKGKEKKRKRKEEKEKKREKRKVILYPRETN